MIDGLQRIAFVFKMYRLHFHLHIHLHFYFGGLKTIGNKFPSWMVLVAELAPTSQFKT